MQIHSTAVVSPSARIGANCRVGPYAVVGDEVILGDGVHIHGHSVIDGRTRIGDETEIFPFVSIGLPPQDLKFAGEPSETEIGRRNRIREFVTIHRGTLGGGGITKTGDDCFIMAQAHIAHDCLLGNQVIMANAATLAGHVTVADGANIGAYSGGYSRETIAALHHAFHLLLSAKLNTTQALDRIREEVKNSSEVNELVRFVETSQRGVVK